VVANETAQQRPTALAQAPLLPGQGAACGARQLVPEAEQALRQLPQLLAGPLGRLAGPLVQSLAGSIELAVGGVVAAAPKLVEVGVALAQLAARHRRYLLAVAQQGGFEPGQALDQENGDGGGRV
jgi:hypothetical protein